MGLSLITISSSQPQMREALLRGSYKMLLLPPDQLLAFLETVSGRAGRPAMISSASLVLSLSVIRWRKDWEMKISHWWPPSHLSPTILTPKAERASATAPNTPVCRTFVTDLTILTTPTIPMCLTKNQDIDDFVGRLPRVTRWE